MTSPKRQPIAADSFVTHCALIGILASFLLLRGPVMYRQPGGQDEDCYAVPGLTILSNGVPRLPHVPARNLESVYYHADDMLYSEPPLYFYAQSIFYMALPPVYGTARFASAVIGLLGAGLLFQMNRRTQGSGAAGLWAVGLFVFSRWFYFPAMTARPDILCTTIGFATVLLMMRWRASNRVRWLVATGVCIGAGGLTHPFALVYGVQMAVWAMIVSRGWRRLINPAILASVSILVACCWIPLVLMYPDAFAVQFKNQFLGDQGGSLWYRIAMPWESLWYHTFAEFGMVNHISIWQILLATLPLVYCTIRGWRERSALLPICWLAISSIYLMSVIVGPHHPVIGYWSYSAGLMFLCTGRCVDDGLRWLAGRLALRGKLATWVVGLGLCCSMVPGSGLTTLYVHLVHWKDLAYNAPKFAKQMALSLPSDSIIAVDTQFLLDFLVNDRQTLLAQTIPAYFRVEDYPFDYLIVSRSGMDTEIAERLNVELLRTEGIKEDKFACYGEIYTPRQRK